MSSPFFLYWWGGLNSRSATVFKNYTGVKKVAWGERGVVRIYDILHIWWGPFCFIKFKNHIEFFVSATETMPFRSAENINIWRSFLSVRTRVFFKWNIGPYRCERGRRTRGVIPSPPSVSRYVRPGNVKIIKHFSGMRKKFDRQIKMVVWNMSAYRKTNTAVCDLFFLRLLLYRPLFVIKPSFLVIFINDISPPPRVRYCETTGVNVSTNGIAARQSVCNVLVGTFTLQFFQTVHTGCSTTLYSIIKCMGFH